MTSWAFCFSMQQEEAERIAKEEAEAADKKKKVSEVSRRDVSRGFPL